MFVAVQCDFSNEDHQTHVSDILAQYGFKEILPNCFESIGVKEKTLLRIKRDVDKACDFYDTIRFYQYPLEGTLVVTQLEKKKWKRTVMKQ